MMAVMGMISCTAELNDPVANSSTNNVLVSKFNAQPIEAGNDALQNLPTVTLKEAENILSALRNHIDDNEVIDIMTADYHDMHKWQIIMKHTIDKKYSFTIQLNLTSYDDGSLFYNGFDNNCNLDKIRWQIGGFSFSTGQDADYFIFNSQSHIYMKVEGEDSPVHYQIPVSITGEYSPNNHRASYTYSL